MTVLLHRFARTCPSCGANQYPYTTPRGRTAIRSTCSPYQCRIERAYAMSGRAVARASYELLPLDDSAAKKGRAA